MDSQSTSSSAERPRLDPIEQPSKLKTKVIYWFTRRQMGKVITPMKVVNARMPQSLRLAYEMSKVEKSLAISSRLRFLVKSYVATLNGCAFCIDIAKADAMSDDVALKIYEALPDFRTSDAFSERERAALAYVEEATQDQAVSDDTFEELARHFDDREIAQLTWLNAMENYYNLLNRPLKIGSDDLYRLVDSK
jgi:alkylhydroperoxidase family enzyme